MQQVHCAGALRRNTRAFHQWEIQRANAIRCKRLVPNRLRRRLHPLDEFGPSRHQTGQHFDFPYMMKVADFDRSKHTSDRGTFTVSGIRGTRDWIASECSGMSPQNSEEDVVIRGSVKSDIFSAGCVFF